MSVCLREVCRCLQSFVKGHKSQQEDREIKSEREIKKFSVKVIIIQTASGRKYPSAADISFLISTNYFQLRLDGDREFKTTFLFASKYPQCIIS